MIIKLKNGDTHYINKLDDFKEVVEPEIYDAIQEFINYNFINNQEDEEKDNCISELEDDLAESEAIRDEYYSILNTASNKIRDLTFYLERNNDSTETSIIIEDISKDLDYLNYDLLSEF
jgi:hypothetical protein